MEEQNHLENINQLLNLINNTNSISGIEINNTDMTLNVKISNSYKNIKIYSNNILGQILEMNDQLSRNMERRRVNESLEVFNGSSLELEEEIVVKDRQLLSSLEEFGPTKNQEDKL